MKSSPQIIFFLGVLFTLAFFSCKNTKKSAANENKVTEDWTTPANITEGLARGNKAPELSGMNPADTVMSLSSLRGYYVLVDFWASWCGPCRAENPNVVKTYKEYRNKKFTVGKGFRIFNVSLDNAKQNWIMAIKKDSLNWPHHISDLRGWNSEHAGKYRVNSIPTNWLIDPRGVIVAQGLHGHQLSAALARYVDTTTINVTPLKNQKNNR